MKKLNNEEKIQLVLDNLGEWIEFGDDDSSMSYAYRNGFDLLAASLWLSTGAISKDIEHKIKGVIIDIEQEKTEVIILCNEANIYICTECNHHAFLEENQGNEIQCSSCLGSAKLEK
jgi:hypothetical protein